MVNDLIELLGIALLVFALSLVFVPLGVGAAGVWLIAVANKRATAKRATSTE